MSTSCINSAEERAPDTDGSVKTGWCKNVQSSNLESDDIVLTSAGHLVLNHYAFLFYLIFSNANAYYMETSRKINACNCFEQLIQWCSGVNL